MSKLREAHALIEDKEHWTTKLFYCDANGLPVSNGDIKEAKRFCAEGALRAAWVLAGIRDVLPFQHDRLILSEAASRLFPVAAKYHRPVMYVNDELGHEAVMQVFEKAIVEEYGSL